MAQRKSWSKYIKNVIIRDLFSPTLWKTAGKISIWLHPLRFNSANEITAAGRVALDVIKLWNNCRVSDKCVCPAVCRCTLLYFSWRSSSSSSNSGMDWFSLVFTSFSCSMLSASPASQRSQFWHTVNTHWSYRSMLWVPKQADWLWEGAESRYTSLFPTS